MSESLNHSQNHSTTVQKEENTTTCVLVENMQRSFCFSLKLDFNNILSSILWVNFSGLEKAASKRIENHNSNQNNSNNKKAPPSLVFQ